MLIFWLSTWQRSGWRKTGRGVCSPSSLSLRPRASRGSPPLKSVESRTVPLQSTMNEHIINLRVVLQVCLPPAARALCTPRWLAEGPPGRAGVRGAPRVGASTAREADGLLPAGCSSWSRSRHRELQDHEVHPAEEAHEVLLRAQELADGPDPLSIRWKPASRHTNAGRAAVCYLPNTNKKRYMAHHFVIRGCKCHARPVWGRPEEERRRNVLKTCSCFRQQECNHTAQVTCHTAHVAW